MVQLLIAWRGKKRRGVDTKTTPQPHFELSPDAKPRAGNLVGGEKEMSLTATAMYRQHLNDRITLRPSLAKEPIFVSENDLSIADEALGTKSSKMEMRSQA
jgi:hypothetical protein